MKSYIVLIFFIIIICPNILIAGSPGPTCPVYWDLTDGIPAPIGTINFDTTTTVWIQNNCIAITKSQVFYGRARDIDGELCANDSITLYYDDCDYKWYKDQYIAGEWDNLSITSFDNIPNISNMQFTFTAPNTPPSPPFGSYRIYLIGKDHGKYGASSLDVHSNDVSYMNAPEPTNGWLRVGYIEPINIVVPEGEINDRYAYNDISVPEIKEQCSCTDPQIPYGHSDFYVVTVVHPSGVSFEDLNLHENVTVIMDECPGNQTPIRKGFGPINSTNHYADMIGMCSNFSSFGNQCIIVSKQKMQIGPANFEYIANQHLISVPPSGLDDLSTDRSRWP